MSYFLVDVLLDLFSPPKVLINFHFKPLLKRRILLILPHKHEVFNGELVNIESLLELSFAIQRCRLMTKLDSLFHAAIIQHCLT